ncbi:MupG family TIM beta-alpha barrel fold protein [Spiroplasma clarkii]|uniref:MupG family TIM beta-alpha barrel fold protein n=1 Tax=Spiroplasma clarkii TaxID=2139 RepID=UPI0021500CCB|nr:MupG family TIM beta-alpha barrel fold protein [Spiroplasma clarkii]
MAKKLGYEITVDTTQKTFYILEIKNYDLSFFNKLGIDVIRFDVIPSPKIIADLTYNEYDIKIEIQMSNDDKVLETILFYQPKLSNLWGCQNFYPQKFTGMSLKQFQNTSINFWMNRIKTTSYLSSENKSSAGPWLINDGTPTLEVCRELSAATQTQVVWATSLVDDLIFANAPAAISEIKKISKLDPYIIQLDIETVKEISEVEKEIIFNNVHFNRSDTNEFFIRSTQPRVKYINLENKARVLKSKDFFEIGDVLIGNNAAGLYKNELQIVTKKIPYDKKKNLVAKVSKENLILLNYLYANKNLNFS